MSADEAFLRHILSGIVLKPEQMRLVRSEDELGILFRIHLAKSDMPLVIGKAGQSIHAVRLLMKIYGKDGPTISVILEEPSERIGGGSGGGAYLA
jgi:predicted RNA-binding protein YlqC (UPF0109 family)